MSKCISHLGEYSEHTPGEGAQRFVCTFCGAFDEDACVAALEAADAKVRAVEALADDMERQPMSEIAPVSGMAIILRAALADPKREEPTDA